MRHVSAGTLGIDLGTTNTAAAVDGELVELPDGGGAAAILPSVVAFPPSRATLIGSSARRRRAIDLENTIYSAKRVIGRGWFEQETREFAERYPFRLVRAEGDVVGFQTRAGVMTPTDIAATLLGVVKRAARAGSVRRTVITVPASFRETSRFATVAAAERAGLPDVRTLDEPIATAWAYLAGKPAAMQRAAVYDLGGGTFNLAIVDTTRAPFEIVREGGDLFLGGDDVDQALARWAAGELLARHGWDLTNERETYDRLVGECERAKIRLSYAQKAELPLAEIDPAAPEGAPPLVLDRALVASLCGELVRRTFVVCDEVLGEAGLKARDIDAVFLAGGSTQLPLVRAQVEQYFGRPARCDYDPLEVVAIGASLCV